VCQVPGKHLSVQEVSTAAGPAVSGVSMQTQRNQRNSQQYNMGMHWGGK
jgi:hypothetical protein